MNVCVRVRKEIGKMGVEEVKGREKQCICCGVRCLLVCLTIWMLFLLKSFEVSHDHFTLQ